MTDATAPMPTGPAPAPSWRPRRRGFLFPILLIAFGVFFFLGNLGYIPPLSTRALLSLWPLFLVIGGIELIIARREPWVALALELGVVALGVALVAAQPYGLIAPLVGSPAGSSFTVPRGTTHTLSLRVDGGAGSYTVSGGATALVEARSDGGEISVRDDRRADNADIRVQPANVGDVFRFGGMPPVNVDVKIAGDVPTSLRVSGGAGDFTVDLRGIQIRDARVDTGASRLELTLPTPSGNVDVRVGAGAASVTIVVPDAVEARITTTGGVISTSSSNARLGTSTSAAIARSGSVMETSGYANAADRVTVTVSAGASSIQIR